MATALRMRALVPAFLERAADEILRLDFTLVDTILDMRYFRDVLPRLREAGADLSLYYATQSNLRRAQVRLLRQAGVNFLQPGIESLSTPSWPSCARASPG